MQIGSRQQAKPHPLKSPPNAENSRIPNWATVYPHSNFSISPFLTFEFTTPPMPKAGTILHILAAALTAQFFFTIFHLSPQVNPLPPLLYKSKPSKCIGVLK